MIRITQRVDLGQGRIWHNPRSFPRTIQAVNRSALDVWRLYAQNVGSAMGVNLRYNGREFVIHRQTGTYAGAITMEPNYAGNPLMALVQPKGVPYAAPIETGYDAFDMKPFLYASPKAKTSKRGYRYMIVPIRKFRREQFGLEPLTESEQFTNPNYSWWNRNTLDEVLAGPASAEKKAFVARTVRHTATQRKHHSQWVQFIAVSERTKPVGSPGWWNPGAEPRPVAHATAAIARPAVEAAIHAAVLADMRAMR